MIVCYVPLQCGFKLFSHADLLHKYFLVYIPIYLPTYNEFSGNNKQMNRSHLKITSIGGKFDKNHSSQSVHMYKLVYP